MPGVYSKDLSFTAELSFFFFWNTTLSGHGDAANQMYTRGLIIGGA